MKARKDHRCTLCGWAIERGCHYVYKRVTPWDHELNSGFFTYRAHQACDDFWNAGYGADCDGEFPIGNEGDFRAAMADATRP